MARRLLRTWLGEQHALTRLVDASRPILTRLFGASCQPDPGTASVSGERLPSELNGYRYLLRTAPPRAIERAHTEAFVQLTPEQRRQLVRQLGQQLPDPERPLEPDLDSRALARLATRAELCHPGLLERALGADTGCPVAPDSLFCAIACAFTATPIAQQYLGGIDHDGMVTRPDGDADLELDYEEWDYETPPLECLLDRNDSAL
jgi:hypothetical protein